MRPQIAAALALLFLVPGLQAQGSTADTILAAYATKAPQPPSAERGKEFFNRRFSGALFASCADCHTAMPTRTGRDEAAGKPLAPLAPAANAKRLTDPARVEYMFKLNCKDVAGRECTAQEKADVIAWLVSLKP